MEILSQSIRVLSLVALCLLMRCSSSEGSRVEVYKVKRGEFLHSITVTGELEAVTATVILAPSIHWRFGNLKISKLAEDGSQVAEGDVLVQFDTSEVEKAISDSESELEIAEAQLRKAQATHRSERESLEIDLEIAEVDRQISELKLQLGTFDAEIEKNKLKLALEKAAIDLQRAREELENKQQINREVINKLELGVKQAKAKLDAARETLLKLKVTAPSPGLAIVKKSWLTREKFQVDDQTWGGMPILELPDLTRMQAAVEISEVDIAKIRVDQESIVRLDAYPDTSFTAVVSEIAVLARSKTKNSKVKVFDATLQIEQPDDRLIPGMTVSCEIIVERVPEAITLPLEALFREGDKTVVYVRDGSRFHARTIVAGMESGNDVLINEGIEVGEEVALVDPTPSGDTQSSKEDGGS